MSEFPGSNFRTLLEENEISGSFLLFQPVGTKGIRFEIEIRSVWEGYFFLSLVS